VTFLIERCFQVDLSTVGSATAVQDARLAELLGDAEKAIEEGRTTQSFKLSWEAVRTGLTIFKRHTGLGGATPRPLRQGFDELSSLNEQMTAISRQLELSLFASEPGEWMWFEQRHDEASRGLEPSVGEARRGFVFALGWVLRMESYVARHGPDRWERWYNRRAPETGLPGGPHLTKEVSHGRDLPKKDGVEWVFQLTDVPDYENPDFGWGISAAHEESNNPLLKHIYLDRDGKLVIRTPERVDPKELVECARGLISSAKQVMERRWLEDEEEETRREALGQPFAVALAAAGLQVRELLVRPADRGVGPLVVWIDLADVGVNGSSWFAKCLEECFDEYLKGYDEKECSREFAGALVPAEWPAERVVAWLAAAKEKATVRDKADDDKQAEERSRKNELLAEIKAELDREPK
jgi:hypothetical protein